MSTNIGVRALSILVVWLMVLSAFVVAFGGYAGATAKTDDVATPLSAGDVDLQVSEPSPIEVRETPWEFKVDRSLRDAASKGVKELQEVIIYTDNMGELAPLLDQYGVTPLPEEFRGVTVRDVTRVRAAAEGIASTRALLPASAIPDIAKLPGVLGIEKRLELKTADFTNYDLTQARERIMELRERTEASSVDPAPTDWGIVKAQKAVDAWNLPGNYRGDGVNVAVQDWGVDFAHPNLVGQWATVADPSSPYFGYPIMHSQESLWNNLELFTAPSDFDRYPYPSFATYGTASWFSDTSYRATRNATGFMNYTWGTEYGPFQFTKRVAPTWGDTNFIDRTYYVGAAGDPWEIPSASGWYHLGISKDKYLEGVWGERVGILVVDSTTPGVYDTVYVDVNDDYNFTNDKPITVTGDPLAGWDIDMDGFYDVSGGLLYYIANRTNSISGEVVIVSATGSETTASLANGWIETDVDGFDLFMATLSLDGMYWPSAGEDIWEEVLVATAADETNTTSSLTSGVNIMTGVSVATAALLLDYNLSLVYDIYNGTESLTAGVDYDIDMSTGEITWLRDFENGDTVEIIYELETWRLDFDTGEITFLAPPVAGTQVTATYNTGLPVPYANVTAQRQGWDLFVPGPGDLVAFHGAFELGQEHGTWVSTNLAGNPVGNLGGILDIWGTAPDVKIIGVDLPTSFDTAELFLFSATGYDGVAGTGDEAQIATNSWGQTTPQETGFTGLERYLYDLTTVQVPDFTILFAAGNNGPGYATSTPPNTAPGVITVGGGTIMNYRWLFGFDGGEAYYDWLFFGQGVYGVGPYGDIVDFASKGPTLMGTPEPDVIAAAAFAFGGRPLNSACLEWFCGGLDAWDLWGGTSMATPVAAGVVALIYQAYANTTGSWPTSTVAKEILMSSADDHGFDVLQQGAGWVNASAAVELASSMAGLRVSPSFLTPGAYEGVHRPAFANLMSPGDSATETLTVFNEGPSTATLTIGDAMYTKIGPDYSFVWNFSTPWASRDYRVLKPSGLYAADGITVIDPVDLSTEWNAADFIRITFVRDPDVLTAAPYTYIELFDWFNWNWGVGNTTGFDDFMERNRFGFYGIRPGATSVTAQIFDPATRVHDGLAISFRDINDAFGLTPVTVEFYGKVDWTWANAEAATGLSVAPGASASFDVTFTVPVGTQAGMYQGAVWVTSGAQTVIVPVLITVPYTGLPLLLGGGTPATTLYDNNGVAQGELPGNWRQIGDSRLFWADFSAIPAANRRMIYNLLLQDAPSEGEITVYQLQPDATWTDDAVYGPGAMVEVASTQELFGATDTLYINREFLHTDVLSAPLAIQVKALNSLAGDEPFSLDVGIMETTPNEARISSNTLTGSAPISVTSDVDLQDGLGTAVTEVVSTTFTGQPVDSYPFPGGSFIQYLFDAPNRLMTVIPAGTIVATWTLFFYGGASDVDMGLFYDVDCDGVYTVNDDAIGTVASTGANPESATISFPAAGCYWVHAAGYTVAAGGGLYDLTLDINKIGVSPFTAQNAPATTVPAYEPTGFDLSWVLPGDRAEGVSTDFLFVSPGFAPFALAQQVTIVFNYDLTPPSFSAHLPAPGSTVSDATPGIFVQVDDPSPGSIARRGEIDGKTIQVWLDGVDITSLAAISAPPQTNQGYNTGTVLFTPAEPLTDGPHTLLVQAADLAGNVGTTTWTFTVDTSAPALDITSPISGLATSASSVTLTGVTEPGAAVTVAGQSVFVDGTGSFSADVSLLAGENAIDVSATDAVGNSATTTVTVIQDATAPAISQLRSSVGVLTSENLAVLSGVVDEPSSLTVAGIPAMVHADGSFDVPVPLVEGTNAISVVATDAAGNQGSTSLTIVRDSSPPVVTLDTLPSETSSATVTVSGTVEAGIGFVTVNGQPVAVSGGSFSQDVVLSLGPNEIFVEATDAAGNSALVSTSVSYIPTGVTAASVGLILLPVLTVIALLAGLAIGQASRPRPIREVEPGVPPEVEEAPPEEAAPPEEISEGEPPSPFEEESPPEGGVP
jgi:uncharacterized protein YfaP (DUF2135 family)